MLSLILRSYELATKHRDKILKGLRDFASQDEIKHQKVYLSPNYQYDYYDWNFLVVYIEWKLRNEY